MMTGAEKGWRQKAYEVIFEADTPAGRAFDIVLIISIVASVLVVMLDSIEAVSQRHGRALFAAEWFFTALFTAEYALRLACVRAPLKYARSFFGVVDLLAVLPTYASLLLPGSQYLLVIRIIRVLRVFRILKFAHHIREARILMHALYQARRKITVFLMAVLTLVVILGSMMYLVEGGEHGFTSIPESIYWAIVTLTTVGYGDISPRTPLGQALASVIMIIGYSIIAVPTGIVTVEIAEAARKKAAGREAHGAEAVENNTAEPGLCSHCGQPLPRKGQARPPS